MAITIRVGDKANRKLVTLEMDVRKSLSGDLMIFDHGDIDIVLSTANNKVTAFPKEVLSDYVYGAQNRLFSFLKKRGVVIPETVRAGAFYGSFEATLQKPINEKISAAKMTLVNISEFINEERPYFEAMEAYVADTESEYVDPDKEKSTELGEVPQASEKGSMRYVRDSAAHYLYTM
tara:strand:- start:1234 stop:1764 length:531 start_codon:yes stop_codon:yes gene_type:complete